MIQPVARIEIYKKIKVGDVISYPSTASFIIDEFTNLKVTHGVERRKDTISFNVINHRELNDDGSYSYTYNFNTVEHKDLIKVYLYYSPMTGVLSDHMVLSGYVKSYNFNSTEGTGTVNFTAFNRTELLLNSFMFTPYHEGNRNVPFMIVDSINRIRTFNLNDNIYAYKDYTGLTSPDIKGAYEADGTVTTDVDAPTFGYVRAYKKDAYKTDGSGDLKDGTGGDPDYTTTVPSDLLFPALPYVENYKPFIEHLIDLSTDKYTEDDTAGVYTVSVDNDNNLHWEPKNFGVPVGNYVFEGDDSSIVFNKNNDNIVNAVILNAGTDPNETGILSLAFNASSMGENGAKWKYLAKVDIADEIKKNEVKSGDHDIDGITIAGTDNVGKSIAENNYPDTYPWTIQTSGRDLFGDWEYISGTSTVLSNTAYKNYFRRVARNMGKKRGENFVKYAGGLLINGNRELENGTLAFSPNQMLNVAVSSFNTIANLRIMTVSHTLTAGRWSTILELKEDIDFNLN